MESYDKINTFWHKQEQIIAQKLKRPLKLGNMASSTNVSRSRHEANLAKDLASDLLEKYGEERGWRFSLRNQSESVQYEEAVGNGVTNGGIYSRINEKRDRTVEIIRKTA